MKSRHSSEKQRHSNEMRGNGMELPRMAKAKEVN